MCWCLVRIVSNQSIVSNLCSSSCTKEDDKQIDFETAWKSVRSCSHVSATIPSLLSRRQQSCDSSIYHWNGFGGYIRLSAWSFGWAREKKGTSINSRHVGNLPPWRWTFRDPNIQRVQHYYIFVLHSHISIALPCELICILNKQPHGSLLTLNPSFVSDHRHSHFRLFPFYPAGNEMYPCIW